MSNGRGKKGWLAMSVALALVLGIPSVSSLEAAPSARTARVQKSVRSAGVNRGAAHRGPQRVNPVRPAPKPALLPEQAGNTAPAAPGPAAPALEAPRESQDSGLRPASAASGPQALKPGDPVYKAWQEFLARRGPEPAAAGAAMPSLEVGSDDGSGPQRSGLGGGLWGSMAVTLFGGMGLAGAFFARKHLNNLPALLRKGGTKDERSRVRVISVSALSAQNSIAVVEVYGELLVLGVSAGRVSLLTRLASQAQALPALEEPRDERPLPSAPKVAPKAAREPADFGGLLNGLLADRENVPREPSTPVGRYAVAARGAQDVAFEPPPEDMAGQVLRRMRTMKRFRDSA